MDITIRKIEITDIKEFQSICKRTFFETYSGQNSPNDMEIHVEENFNINKLTGEILNPNSECFFVVSDNKVVGYMKLNFNDAQTDILDNFSLEIERIYIKKEYQANKMGNSLINKAIEIAKNSQIEYIWLGVWENNGKAINFYKKNNFVEFDKHIFKLGNDMQTDIMMKLVLE